MISVPENKTPVRRDCENELELATWLAHVEGCVRTFETHVMVLDGVAYHYVSTLKKDLFVGEKAMREKEEGEGQRYNQRSTPNQDELK